MSSAPRKVFHAKASSSKERPSGKENECPSAIVTVKKCKQQIPRILVVPCSNDDQTKDGMIFCQQTLAIGNALSSRKKPSFDVHCDEKDAAQRELRPLRSFAAESGTSKSSASSSYSSSTASSRDQRIDRIQPIPQRRGLSRKLSQANGTVTKKRQPHRNENALPSKIPRRASFITDRTYTVDQVATQTSATPFAVTNNVDATVQRNCEGYPGNRIVDSIEPIDSAVYPKTTGTPVKNVRLPESTNSRFGVVVCNRDYHADLPIIEQEKENQAPILSAKFLKEHVNGEQRKLIVIFLLRLGTHCKVASYIIYRAVKIFDATIDRMQVETAFIQITALASLWIALKILENSDKIPTASVMISLAKDLYAGKKHLLIEYERKILQALDYNVCFADAYSLLSYHLINYNFCSGIPQDVFEFLFYAGSYVIDLTLLDENFCRTSVCLVTGAAVELVLGLVLDTDRTDVSDTIRPRWMFWRGLLYGAAATSRGFCFMDRFQNEEMDRCRVAMLRSILNSGRTGSGLEAVHRKYSRSRHGRIAKPLLDLVTKLSPLEVFDP